MVQIWIDLFDLNTPTKNPRMELVLSLSKYSAETPPIVELANQFLLWAKDNIMPDPLVLFQIP